MYFHHTQTAKAAAAAAMLFLPALGLAQVQIKECEAFAVREKAVTKIGPPQLATVDFSGSGGHLDPTPFLQTTIKSLTKTCVFVTFSAQVDPLDNHIVFQASVDDIPMQGHAQFPYITPAPLTPVVWDPEETNLNVSRMVSYTFFTEVGPGEHTVRLRFAGCCSPIGNSAIIRAAVMSVRY